ncbi:MAG TPA: PDZ domain-containing protein, partial [Polyangiaceae bacterium]|nr:PDZ domain-containing protein [Polyangiaceae bacterium]
MSMTASRRLFLAGAAGLSLGASLSFSGLALARGGRAWLGIELAPNDGGGVLAKRVLRGSPADKAGVHDADVIVSVDGSAVSKARDVIEAIANAGPGATIAVH